MQSKGQFLSPATKKRVELQQGGGNTHIYGDFSEVTHTPECFLAQTIYWCEKQNPACKIRHAQFGKVFSENEIWLTPKASPCTDYSMECRTDLVLGQVCGITTRL